MNDNVFTFGSVKGGKTDQDGEEGIPVNDYIVIDIDHEEYYDTGFLIFTPQHLAIMRDEGKGAVPVLVMPIHRVRVAQAVDDDNEDEQPALPL